MTRDLSQYKDRVYMTEIEDGLQRHRSTIRTWEDKGWLPDELKFNRDEANLRYWTREQFEKAKIWMTTRRPGPAWATQRRAD
jgi:hypothetical protein